MSPHTLADLLPAVARSLGHCTRNGRPDGVDQLELPPFRVAVVFLVDGLGERLLLARGGHAPFLRDLRAGSQTGQLLTSGFPSTTATSMGMFGTGLPPGAHGLVGVEVLDPARDVLFSELAWDPAVDPRAWQPNPTVFEHLAAAGVDAVRIGPAYFDGSGLTEASLRGGRFVAAETLDQRVEATVAAAKAMRSGLVYVYWGEVDKVGHVHGCESWQWGEELTLVDRAVARLAERLPPGCLLVVTADHGMVDVPLGDRVDVAAEPELAAGVRHVGGEPRALHLYCRDGARDDVVAAWRARFGAAMTVLSRAEAVAAGWFGPVAPHVIPRIGDVVVSADGPIAVVDSRTARPELLRLVGLHGARTPEECEVPLLLLPTS